MKSSNSHFIKGIISIFIGTGSLILSFYLRSRLDEIYQKRLEAGNTTPPLQMVGISLILIAVIGTVYGIYSLIEGHQLRKRENVTTDFHPLKK